MGKTPGEREKEEQESRARGNAGEETGDARWKRENGQVIKQRLI